MLKSDNIEIENNDVYVLGITKNYIVVNNNYNGLVVLDRDFSYLKNIDIDEDIVIYQLFSSEMNDYVIIQDIESETLYSIDIITDEILQVNWKLIFDNYYYVQKDTFYLKSKNSQYLFDYQNLEPKLQKETKDNNNIILASSQEDILYLKNTNEITYKDKIIEVSGDHDYGYGIEKNHIIKYSEEVLYLFSKDSWHPIFKVKEDHSIRKCVISFEYVYVLLNNKMDVSKSEIQKVRL